MVQLQLDPARARFFLPIFQGPVMLMLLGIVTFATLDYQTCSDLKPTAIATHDPRLLCCRSLLCARRDAHQ